MHVSQRLPIVLRGTLVFQGPTQMTRGFACFMAHASGSYACEMDPVLEYSWRRFNFGVIRRLFGDSDSRHIFNTNRCLRMPPTIAFIQCIQVFFSSPPTGKVDRMHASYHGTRDCPALDQPELHCPARRYDSNGIRIHAVSLMKCVANMASALWHFARLEKLLTLLKSQSQRNERKDIVTVSN